MVAIHGLAASIRSAEENETFDLAGQTLSTIGTTIQVAFKDPFPPQTKEKNVVGGMIRITFIVGAGKQARQKYDDNTAKTVVSELQKCGYYEDRAASCIPECAGAYKLQHDTAKNLKTIIVFPKIASIDESVTHKYNNSSNNINNSGQDEALIPLDSPGYKLAAASMTVFQNMVRSKCPSWSQKKGCLTCIESIKEMIQVLDSKLMTGIVLTNAEQTFYNVVTNLDQKVQYIKDEMHKQVDDGKITQYDKSAILDQNTEKILLLKQEHSSITKAQQRKELIEKIQPIPLHPLKFDNEIRALQRELIPLIQFYEQNKNKLLTNIKDSQKITRKDEIEQQIIQLEQSSIGWFEDDIIYQKRVQASREYLVNALKTSKKQLQSSSSSRSYASAIGTSTSSSAADSKISVSSKGTKFVVPSSGSGGSYAFSANKSKGKLKGTNLFGAMMIDSDEDDDSDKDVPMKQTTTTITRKVSPTKAVQSSQRHQQQSMNEYTTIYSKKKKGQKGQNIFGTMTSLDSNNNNNNKDDEDSEDESSDEEGNIERESVVNTNDESNVNNTKTISKKNKKKKSGNKSKSHHQQQQQSEDQAGEVALDEALEIAKRLEMEKENLKRKELENTHPAIAFIKIVVTILWELFLTFITWIATLVLGNNKKHQQRKKQK